MKRIVIAAALAAALPLAASAQQSPATGELQSEVLISTLPTAELTKQITAATGTIEHKSEVARGERLNGRVRSRRHGSRSDVAPRLDKAAGPAETRETC